MAKGRKLHTLFWTDKLLVLALVAAFALEPCRYAQASQNLPTAGRVEKVNTTPVPKTWLVQFCQKFPLQACLAAESWSWFREQEIYIDVGLDTAVYFGAAGSIAMLATKVVGEKTTLQLIITGSQYGLRVGWYIVLGTALAIAVGAVSSVLFYFGSTEHTGDYLDDKPELAKSCLGVDLNAFKTVEGQAQLMSMSLAEAEKILPCLPQDHDLLESLKKGAANGQQIVNQP